MVVHGRTFAGTGGTTEQLFGTEEIPHSYKEGTDLNFHVHWMPTTTGLGNVKRQLTYVWMNYSGIGGTPTTISIIQAASGIAWQHLKPILLLY